jgi:hypothetical protein
MVMSVATSSTPEGVVTTVVVDTVRGLGAAALSYRLVERPISAWCRQSVLRSQATTAVWAARATSADAHGRRVLPAITHPRERVGGTGVPGDVVADVLPQRAAADGAALTRLVPRVPARSIDPAGPRPPLGIVPSDAG